MSLLLDLCNSSGGIILYCPQILSDSGRFFSVSSFLMSYVETDIQFQPLHLLVPFFGKINICRGKVDAVRIGISQIVKLTFAVTT
jgi:hypothetical protein